MVVVSGYLLPWSLGRELDVFEFGIPSPMTANRGLHEFVERVHDVTGHLFIPLVGLHVLGAIKHAIFDRRGAGLRMFKPTSGGVRLAGNVVIWRNGYDRTDTPATGGAMCAHGRPETGGLCCKVRRRGGELSV